MEEMIKSDIGIVRAVDGNTVTLELCLEEGCSSCAMNGMCGMGSKAKTITVETDVPVQVGDTVVMNVHGGSQVVSSVVLFLIPIIMMVIGFIIGKVVFRLSEGTSVFISILGLGLSLIVIRVIDHYYGNKLTIEILPKED